MLPQQRGHRHHRRRRRRRQTTLFPPFLCPDPPFCYFPLSSLAYLALPLSRCSLRALAKILAINYAVREGNKWPTPFGPSLALSSTAPSPPLTPVPSRTSIPSVCTDPPTPSLPPPPLPPFVHLFPLPLPLPPWPPDHPSAATSSNPFFSCYPLLLYYVPPLLPTARTLPPPAVQRPGGGAARKAGFKIIMARAILITVARTTTHRPSYYYYHYRWNNRSATTLPREYCLVSTSRWYHYMVTRKGSAEPRDTTTHTATTGSQTPFSSSSSFVSAVGEDGRKVFWYFNARRSTELLCAFNVHEQVAGIRVVLLGWTWASVAELLLLYFFLLFRLLGLSFENVGNV